MPFLIVSCDEKWPVYDLEVPEEGQDYNIEIPTDVYEQYLFVSDVYSRMQKILRIYYEVSQRNSNEESCGGCLPEDNEPQCFPKGQLRIETTE